VRYIDFEQVSDTVESLCIAACYELPQDVLTAIESALKKESNQQAQNILSRLIDNAHIAAEEKRPLCQDTGLAVVFVEQGADLAIKCPPGTTLLDAINAGVAAGYEKGYLRKSVVAEPLNERINTRTNTPAIVHICIVKGDKLKLSVMAKGGGCENKSQFKMFRPTADRSEIIEWVVEVAKTAGADACPPFVVGVGIGGDFELSAILSKKALLRDMTDKNHDSFYSTLELDMLIAINNLGIGPQGFGGDTTALACKVETAPCHIASLPIAVNIECHSHRHKTKVI
jgi:fumarate hydratase subunit alpha